MDRSTRHQPSDPGSMTPAPPVFAAAADQVRDSMRGGEWSEDDFRIFGGTPPIDLTDPRSMAQLYITYTSIRELRHTAVQAAAIGGALIWTLTAWPRLLPALARQDALIAWAFLLLLAAVLRVVEWKRQGQLRRAVLKAGSGPGIAQ